MSADGCGSARWRAPEMFIGTANKKGKMIGDICTNKIDVYGYSIILWELFHMSAITWEEDLDEMVERKVLSEQRMKLLDNRGSSWKQLIQSCWNQDPEQRPSFHRIVQTELKFSNKVSFICYAFGIGTALEAQKVAESSACSN